MIEVGRRPVLILWGTIVAERLGFERDEALTLGRALATLGGHLINEPAEVITPAKIAEMRRKLPPGRTINFSFVDRVVSVARVPEGLRAVVKKRPLDPASVEVYLGEKFGDQIDSVAGAMISLAETLPPSLLAERAFELYEQFRPETSELDINRIAASIRSKPRHDAADDDGLSESWWEDAQGEMPSFRGPQALIGGVVRSHVVEPVHRERTACLAPVDDAPGSVVDAPKRKTRTPAIELPAAPHSTVAALSPLTQPMLAGAIPAHRSMSPLALILAVTLAGAIGGGVGGLLVALPQHTTVVSELRGLFPFHLHTSSPAASIFEAETRSDAYSDPTDSSPARGPIATAISTPLAPATAAPSTTATGAQESPPVDDQNASEAAGMERRDEAPVSETMAVEMSLPLAPTAAAVPPPPPVNGAPESPSNNQAASETAGIERRDEAPASEPIALDMSPPPPPGTAVVPQSRTADAVLDYPSVDSPGAAEVARMAMQRGDERMRQGDVIAARRFYQIAAGAGMAEAATAVGRTFDPLYLTHIRVRGPLADAQRAKQWYEKAAKTGDMEALARIELMTWENSHR